MAENPREDELQSETSVFLLNEEEFAAFERMLNAPPKPNAKLRELFRRTPIWKDSDADEG